MIAKRKLVRLGIPLSICLILLFITVRMLMEPDNSKLAFFKYLAKIGQSNSRIDLYPGPHKSQRTRAIDYDEMVFFTVVWGELDSSKFDVIRALIGGLHQIRAGVGLVPKTYIFVANPPDSNEAYTRFQEELSWAHKVSLQSLNLFLGLPISAEASFESHMNLQEKVNLAIMERLVEEHGHAIWIKLGYTIDPVNLAIWRAEKKGSLDDILVAYSKGKRNLLDAYANGQQTAEDLLDAYANGRQAVTTILSDLDEYGWVQVLQEFPVLHSNGSPVPEKQLGDLFFPNELIMEGYSQTSSNRNLVNLKDRLHCVLLGHEQCDRGSQLISRWNSDYGIYPFYSSSSLSCMVDIGRANVARQVLLQEVVATVSSAVLAERANGISVSKKIALLVPTTSVGSTEGDRPVFLEALLPSLLSTISDQEYEKFSFVIYVGFDAGDPVWNNFVKRQGILESAQELIKNKPVEIKCIIIPKIKRVATIWNILYFRAIRDRCDYFYQVNDDLTMVSHGWVTKLTTTLDLNNGVGVAGPADNFHNFNCSLLTQAMVTRKHFDMFGTLYPPELRDWKSDRWLTYVYQPSHVFCSPELIANNGAAKTRYHRCEALSWIIHLEAGRRRLAKFISID